MLRMGREVRDYFPDDDASPSTGARLTPPPAPAGVLRLPFGPEAGGALRGALRPRGREKLRWAVDCTRPPRRLCGDTSRRRLWGTAPAHVPAWYPAFLFNYYVFKYATVSGAALQSIGKVQSVSQAGWWRAPSAFCSPAAYAIARGIGMFFWPCPSFIMKGGSCSCEYVASRGGQGRGTARRRRVLLWV